jgi:hypothetical protein
MNVFRMQGIAFIPDKSESDTDRESDTKTYTGVNCLIVIYKLGDTMTLSTTLELLISTYVNAYLFHIIHTNAPRNL